MKPLSISRARALLRSMSRGRVLVVGDVMLDEFLWGKAARLSPEAPVPVVEVERQSFHLGGAANVAANVRALGGQALLVGVIGADEPGRRLVDELRAAGIEQALKKARDGRPTTVKTRILAQHQQVVRADRERSDDVDGGLEGELLASLRAGLEGAGAVIVSDYQKGVVTPAVMKSLLRSAARRRVPVLVDPKVRHFPLYRGVALVTPNLLEAEQATGLRLRGQAELEAAGARLLAQLRCRAALITRGEHGMSLFERGRRPAHVPTAAREVFDVTGAGDTVIATLGLALAAGAGLREAAVLANHAAGVVVGKLGTACATPEEVLGALESTDP